jgi:hypothetical protein
MSKATRRVPGVLTSAGQDQAKILLVTGAMSYNHPVSRGGQSAADNLQGLSVAQAGRRRRTGKIGSTDRQD